MPFVVPQSLEEVEAAVLAYGPAPGGVALMRLEAEAAAEAAASGVYITWRCARVGATAHGRECARVGGGSRCLCGCALRDHAPINARNPRPPRCRGRGGACGCASFDFAPSRPEELGMWWLPRRQGFDVRTWRALCRCGHGHDVHARAHESGRCSVRACGCGRFASDYACVTCECSQEGHETAFETEAERRAAGRPTGRAFEPLADSPFLQHAVAIAARGARSGARGASGGARHARGGVAGAAAERRWSAVEMGAAEGGNAAHRASAAAGSCALASPDWAASPHGALAGSAAMPIARLLRLSMADGQRATVLTNVGAPLPQPGRSWVRSATHGGAMVGAGAGAGGGAGAGAGAGARRATCDVRGSSRAARHGAFGCASDAARIAAGARSAAMRSANEPSACDQAPHAALPAADAQRGRGASAL